MTVPIESSVNLRIGGATAKVKATTDPATGITDMDAQSLDAAMAALQPHADAQRLEDEATVARFAAFADNPDADVTMKDVMGLFGFDDE